MTGKGRMVVGEEPDDVGSLYELGCRYEAIGEGGQCCPFDTDYGCFRLVICSIRGLDRGLQSTQ